jgi:arginine transport system substrate-binding protein
MDANNQIVGFDLDLAKALCKQMQADCTFTNHAFDSLIPALKFKKYDAVISGMDITPERSKQVAFTDPYYANSALVIAKRRLPLLCRSERQTYWHGKRHHPPEIPAG